MTERTPGAFLPPTDRSIRAALEPVSEMEGDEPAVVAPDDPLGAALTAHAGGHVALAVTPSSGAVGPDAVAPTSIVLGELSRDGAGLLRREIVVDGWRFVVSLVPERLARLRERASSGRAGAAGGGRIELRAVIPGRVVAVSVAVGDQVEAGQQVLVIEAMKMQNEVRAPHAGTVERIDVVPGRTVELGTILVVIG